MPLLASAKGGVDFEPLSVGLHHAVCYGVVDLGTQPTDNPQFKASRKVAFLFEVPSERLEFEKDGVHKNLPRGVNGIWTLSLGKRSKLLPMLESWRGRPFTAQELEGFDVFSVLNANCFINIIHKERDGKTFANIANVNPVPKGTVKLKPENPNITFALPLDMMDLVFPSNMPEWMQIKVKQSNEFQFWLEHKDDPSSPPATEGNGAAVVEEFDDSDVPFN